MGVQKGASVDYPREIEIIVANEFLLKAIREDAVKPQHTVLYKIYNLEEIVQNTRHRDILLDWVIGGSMQLKEKMKQNDMKVAAKKTTSGELSDFV